MATKTLEAIERTDLGTGGARRLRRDKKIPAVVYGHGEPKLVYIDSHNFELKFKHVSENEIINLTIGKESFEVLIKDYQSDILRGKVTHLDFYEVEKGKLLRTHVPIRLVGSPKGVREGGIMENPLHEFEVECLPKDLPEFIEINVADLDTGHALHAGDVVPPVNVKILNNHDQVVAFVGHAKTATTVVEDEAEGEEA
jgi:large subunit ribosomal protein L25